MPSFSTAEAGQVTAAVEVTEITRWQAAQAQKPAAEWTPGDFARWVGAEIERASGPQLPCRSGDKILTGFWDRHGPEKAVRIARAAFEVFGGMWCGAPVTVRRFSESHDQFFASAVLERLGAGGVVAET